MTNRQCIVQVILTNSAVALVGLQCQGQLIGPERRVDTGNPNSGVEASGAFCRSAAQEGLVSAIDWRLGGSNPGQPRAGVGITFNGGTTWQQGIVTLATQPPVPFANQFALDPRVWADPITGDLWLVVSGGDINADYQQLYAVRRLPGQDISQLAASAQITFQDPIAPPPVIVSSEDHIAFMAAGPSPLNAPHRNMYIAFSRVRDTILPFCTNPVTQNYCHPGHGALIRSEDEGLTWSPTMMITPPGGPSGSCDILYPRCEFVGNPNGLVVVDRPPYKGLVVVIMGDYTTPDEPGAVGLSAVWSADGGSTWPSLAQRKLVIPTNQYPTGEGANQLPGPTRVPVYSDIALDPLTGDIYVVASARKTATSQNLDLFIIRGRQNSADPNNPITFDPPVNLNLDPTNWGDGPDQFMPSIAIDGHGGINLLYYDTRHSPIPNMPDTHPSMYMDAYYTRVTNFSTSPVVNTWRLTTSTFCTRCEDCGFSPCPYEDVSLLQFIGDYNDIDADQCTIMLSYMTLRTGKRHYYSRRVNICPADANMSTVVDELDPAAYQLLFATSDPAADIDMNGDIDLADFAEFTQQYLNNKP